MFLLSFLVVSSMPRCCSVLQAKLSVSNCVTSAIALIVLVVLSPLALAF